ncbi:autotransporter outer membrane beta-barrel domain-containing protein, partial [Helicobacter brantae]
STTTIGNPTLTLDSSKNLNVNIDSTSSLTLASVSTSSGAFNASGDGSLTATNITSSSTSGSNTINVGTLTLSGNLTAQQGSTNSITANTATFSGEISANNNNASSRNLITINESVTFNTNASIKADSNNNNTGNIFKLNGAVNGTITEVTSKQVNTKNILSFDGTTANTLTINDINKTDTLSSNASGYVYIGKNLTSGSGSSLALASGVNNNWNSSDYTANLNLKVTNNIYSKSKGFNYINVASLEVGTTGQDNTGTITSDGATNNIATSGRFKANKITSESGGVMNVFIGGNGEIGSINAGGGSGSGNGTNTITFTGANTQSIVKGDITTTTAGTGTTKVNNLTLSGSNATLTLEGKDANGTTHAITTLNASGANTILVLDNSKVTSGAMSTTIGTLSNGANLTATLKGQGTDKEVTLALNGGTLKALTLGETSTGNILDLSNATSMSITNQVNVGNGQDLTIKLKNTTLALNGGLSTSGNGSKIELVGDDTNTSNATLTGRAVALSNLALSATTSNTLTISSSSAVIDSISASGTTSNTIALSGTRTTITSAINVNDTNNNNPLSFEVTNSTLVFGSSDNTITSLTSNGGLVDLSVGVKPAGQDISTQDAITGLTPALLTRGLVREGEESGVVTTPEAPVVTDPQAPSVDSQPSTTPSTNTGSKDARNTLTITSGFTGEATFKLYASSNTADRVVFTQASTLDAGDDADNSSNVTGKAIIALTGNSDIYNITFDENGSDNIMVADASGANGSVEVVGGESMIGTSTAIVNLVTIDEKTYIGDVVEGEINQSLQAIASSALAVNYDLYLANFNSLNKRMGELRDNDHNQGVWARVFGGNMSNSFGAGSKTDYLTAQAGYDYSLSVGENARNYMGIALAYGTSSTKSNTLGINAIGTPFESIALDRVDSNMVEVGLYNSYVADSGWYNDTILKFDYIMSEFSLSNDTSVMSKTNNFAMVLSDEFGYRYSFAENEKGSWYIDPQVEVAFGYFNQSDFNRAVLNNDKVPANLNASQDAILTLRSRIGASLGKKFTTDKGFASLYVGASYEYDYIEGGQSEASTRSGGYITQLDKVESNGRAVLNVGSNIELTKGARLYIDVEKSFGDKQRTFMQFNLGARYSF